MPLIISLNIQSLYCGVKVLIKLKQLEIFRLISIFALIMSIPACSRSPKPNYFVLNPAHFFSKSMHTQTSTIGIDPIATPQYLQKPQLAVRMANNQVSYDEFNRWAEQFDSNITRVLQTNLNKLLPKCIVESSPWPIGFTPTYRVQIKLIRFEANHKGYSILQADYQIVNHTGDKFYAKKTKHYRRKLPNLRVHSIVDSMNANLTAFSQHIAQSLHRLQQRLK